VRERVQNRVQGAHEFSIWRVAQDESEKRVTESVLVERVGDNFLLTFEDGREDDFGPVKPQMIGGNEEWLHTHLATHGWLRVGPAEGDPIAGLYVRKVAHG
jgi:hypothetical protein